MKNILSSLTESEKNRILEMHKSATSRQYLMEQDLNDPRTWGESGIQFVWPQKPGKDYYPGKTPDNTAITVQTTDGKTYSYFCIADPYFQKGIKKRKVKDSSGREITVDTESTLNGTLQDSNGVVNPKNTVLTNKWKEILSEQCKPLYTWYYAEKQKMESEGQQTAGQQTNTEYQKPINIVAKGDPTKVLQQHMSAKLVTGPMNPDGSYNVINDFTYNNTPYKKGQKIKFMSQ